MQGIRGGGRESYQSRAARVPGRPAGSLCGQPARSRLHCQAGGCDGGGRGPTHSGLCSPGPRRCGAGPGWSGLGEDAPEAQLDAEPRWRSLGLAGRRTGQGARHRSGHRLEADPKYSHWPGVTGPREQLLEMGRTLPRSPRTKGVARALSGKPRPKI